MKLALKMRGILPKFGGLVNLIQLQGTVRYISSTNVQAYRFPNWNGISWYFNSSVSSKLMTAWRLIYRLRTTTEGD